MLTLADIKLRHDEINKGGTVEEAYMAFKQLVRDIIKSMEEGRPNIGWQTKASFHRSIEWKEDKFVVTVDRGGELADGLMYLAIRQIANEMEKEQLEAALRGEG